MKVWYSFAGEHSTNMRIVGHFENEENANKAAEFLTKLINVKDKRVIDGYKYSEEMDALLKEYDFHNFNESDFAELEFLSPVEASGSEVTFDSNDVIVSAITRIFYYYGAKIEIYNRDKY